MIPLVAGAFLLWFGLGYRYTELRQFDRGLIVERNTDHLIKMKSLIHGVVLIAPLMGLLGTVTGMIETFDSMGDMTLFSQSSSIAGGVGQALFTTQLGLIVAIPGMIGSRLLNRMEERIRANMEKTEEKSKQITNTAMM